MVSGIASYGGLPSRAEGERSVLDGVPRRRSQGNPCGSGSSNVVTTLILPPSTQVDSSRQIRCYGLPRNHDENTPWQDLGNQSWSFLGSSGPYCPTQPSISPYHQGGLQFGFRPLANGQMFWIFVPVKSSAPLIGAGGPSPGHGFTWLTDATGVYANPGRSFVWANVFSAGSAQLHPFIYFAREPAAIPFWKDEPERARPGPRTASSVFANLYSAFKPGTFCFELYMTVRPQPTRRQRRAASGGELERRDHEPVRPLAGRSARARASVRTGASSPFSYATTTSTFTIRVEVHPVGRGPVRQGRDLHHPRRPRPGRGRSCRTTAPMLSGSQGHASQWMPARGPGRPRQGRRLRRRGSLPGSRTARAPSTAARAGSSPKSRSRPRTRRSSRPS